jgi:hypothetical protein
VRRRLRLRPRQRPRLRRPARPLRPRRRPARRCRPRRLRRRRLRHRRPRRRSRLPRLRPRRLRRRRLRHPRPRRRRLRHRRPRRRLRPPRLLPRRPRPRPLRRPRPPLRRRLPHRLDRVAPRTRSTDPRPLLRPGFFCAPREPGQSLFVPRQLAEIVLPAAPAREPGLDSQVVSHLRVVLLASRLPGRREARLPRGCPWRVRLDFVKLRRSTVVGTTRLEAVRRRSPPTREGAPIRRDAPARTLRCEDRRTRPVHGVNRAGGALSRCTRSEPGTPRRVRRLSRAATRPPIALSDSIGEAKPGSRPGVGLRRATHERSAGPS